MIDDDRHFGIGCDGREFRSKLFPLADIDGDDAIGQPRFFEEDQYLLGVGRGPVMKVYHNLACDAGSNTRAG
jgi:hypothetical protein